MGRGVRSKLSVFFKETSFRVESLEHDSCISVKMLKSKALTARVLMRRGNINVLRQLVITAPFYPQK